MLRDRRTNQLTSAGALLLVAAATLLVQGCRQRPTTVSGNVTLDGEPLTIAKDARGTVVFQPDGGLGTVATGLIDPSGHFDLATGASNEVAPGNYYVTVSVAQLLPKSDQDEQGSHLLTPAKYTSARSSGLIAKVLPGENHLKFELSSSTDNGDSSASDSTSDTPQAVKLPASAESTEKK